MNPIKLEIHCALQIQKSPEYVFEAIVDPVKMSKYFISRSEGLLEAGKTLHWEFPEFKDQSWPVRVDILEENHRIVFFWEGAEDHETRVEITLESRENGSTLVRISEKVMNNDVEGIKWLIRNTEGWTNFLCCLKAYLEYGINLRKGGYDFLIQ